MARQAQGWKLRLNKYGIYQVRFRHQGQRREITTGERDIGLASKKAALIYSEVISGRWDRQLVIARPGQPVDEVMAAWLESLQGLVAKQTYKFLERHARRLARFYQTLDRVTGTADYSKARLKVVKRSTVTKEISTLRRFMTWAAAPEHKYITAVPALPYPGKDMPGTPDKERKHKTKAVPLSRREAMAILREMPEVSERARRGPHRHSVRDFFIVLWETGLRPVTVEKIEAPTHYRRGTPEIKITETIDKVAYERDIDVTPIAQAALDRWAKDIGPVFGAHDLRVPFRKACRAAAAKGKLEKWKAEEATPYDFRHGRITDLLDQKKATLVGVAFLVGHKHITTTNKYTHPERRQAREALGLPPMRRATGRR